MSKKAFYVLLTLLAGCATYPSSYNPEKLPETDLATVNFEKLTFWEKGTKFQGYMVAAFDSTGKKVIETQTGFGYGTKFHEEVKLPAGKYAFVAYCTNGSVFSNPRMALDIIKGKTYTLACRNQTEKGFLGLEMNKSVSLELLTESK